MDSPHITSQLFGQRTDIIERYAAHLGNAVIWGYLGPQEYERVWDRHIYNSVSFASLIPHGASVADVGSGAGLPGLPLAIMRPDLSVVLIESMSRRVRFLEDVVSDLGLKDQVSIIRARAAEVSDTFDVVTCRAVAALHKLVRWTHHMFPGDGQLLALKGAQAEAEIADSAAILKRYRLEAEVLTVTAHPETESTTVVRVRRGGSTGSEHR